MKVAVIYVWVPGSHDGYAETFARSYREHSAGVDHELVVAAKTDVIGVRPSIPADHWVPVGEAGWDIGPFLVLAGAYREFDRVVLLGSYSRVLQDEWLGKLTSAGPLASATGSYEVRPHLRTSCLSVNPRLLADLALGPVVSKEDCWAFEHGPDCIYQAARRNGVHGAVIGADGVYLEPDWSWSRTYRGGGQENLICADHRTDYYANASGVERAHLERLAWGTAATATPS